MTMIVPVIVGISGGSASGKTTLANKIQKEFGSGCSILSLDNYYKDFTKAGTDINKVNFDEIIPLMQEVQKQGADFHSVILLRGVPANLEMGMPPLKELRQAGPQIFKILNDYNYGLSFISSHILKNFHRYLWNVSLATLEQKRQAAVPGIGE